MQGKRRCLIISNVCLCVRQETIFQEQVEGLVEEENEEEEAAPIEEEEGVAVGAIALAEKKTERQRKKERAEKIKVHTLYKLAHFRWFNFKKVLVQIVSLFCFNISPIEVVIHRQVWAVKLMTKSKWCDSSCECKYRVSIDRNHPTLENLTFLRMYWSNLIIGLFKPNSARFINHISQHISHLLISAKSSRSVVWLLKLRRLNFSLRSLR